MKIFPAGTNSELVAQYVMEKTGDTFVPELYQAMAILDDDMVFQGGVVFYEYREFDCTMSIAVENPMAFRGPVLRGIFDYVFNQLGCARCTALIKKSNRRSRALVEAAGFTLEGNIRKGYEGVKDVLIYGMLAEECVYIQEVADVEEPEATAPVAPSTASDEAAAPVSDGPTEDKQVAEFW